MKRHTIIIIIIIYLFAFVVAFSQVEFFLVSSIDILSIVNINPVLFLHSSFLCPPLFLFQVYFVYKEKMPRAYVWTIFVVATFVFVESICTIIVVTTT